ncbi:MAG TPA: 4'-phosphopantetheinyl transferase superfamily protein [Burkholderiales bacterium]|nr:4'-phosphopantetheinyl transferase superfamily protein [Burkholderiales bacterium]
MSVSPDASPERWSTDGAIEVVVTRLDPGPEAVRALSTWLSDAERQRARRFRFDRDRRRFIVARARLRMLLAARCRTRPEAIEFVYRRNGKPALAPRFADTGWRFNLSHCDDAAVYAFSRGREIGIDVEAIRAVREADDIAARFFSRRENEAYLALAPRDKPLGFFNCWTRKEAFVKALGDGLSMPLDQFDVSLAPAGWRLHSFSPLPGFIAAVASHRG